jgi:hypothetical protein
MPAPKDPVKRALWVERMSKARMGKKKPPASEEQKRKQSEAMKGRYVGENNPMYGVYLTGERNPFFGKHHTEEAKKKNREAHVGGLVSEETRRKNRDSHIGKTHTDETRKKMSESKKGILKSESHKQKLRDVKLATTPTGKDSWNWKGGITKLNIHIRQLPRYKLICEELMREVDYTDKFTGKRGGVLSCHHIIPQNLIITMYNIKTIDDARDCPLLFDKHNLLVMLKSAHDKFHNLYGDDKNIYELTPDQIAELYTQ